MQQKIIIIIIEGCIIAFKKEKQHAKRKRMLR